jgi:aldose 1-epimerase
MIVKLQAGDYTALINTERGANCISLRNSKYNAVILREPNKSGVLDNPYLYGMPILYPVNRISGGSFEFEGRIYRFPINEPQTNCHLHGMMHEMEFEISEIGDSFVKCVFERQYLDFPHRFRVEMKYSLSENGLLHKTKITNLSSENMPNFLGFHTTFNIPFLKGALAENVRLYAEIGNEIERDRNYLPTGKLLLYDDVAEKINIGEFMPLEKVISRHCKSKKGGQIELTDIKQGIKLVYENDEKFGWRLFYNGSADDYICLEPMTCMANCQNSPFDREYAGFDSIAPYSSKEYVSRIFLEKMM